MTDYCGCGLKATQLCGNCRQPTCSAKRREHEATIANIPMGYGVVVDLRAGHMAGRGVCPACIQSVAEHEYESQLHPVMGIYGDTAFEKACIGMAFWSSHLSFPRTYRVPGLQLAWDQKEWRGPYLFETTVGEFAREFVSTARRRGVQPVSIKTSTFTTTNAYVIDRDTDGRSYPAMYVTYDGSSVFDPPGFKEKPRMQSAHAPFRIPAGSAKALGLPLH